MIDRRDFTKLLGLSALAAGFNAVPAIAGKHAPQFSLTMDDFFWQTDVKLTGAERNAAILDVFQKHSTKAALFVIGRNIEADQGKQLLSAWNKAGHMIGNHTYSHQSLNAPNTDVKAYEADILRAEELMKDFSRFRKYFRFPALKEGETAAKRDELRAFLAAHGYRTGHVTIDNSDWAIERRLIARLEKDPSADVKPYRDFYLEHMFARADYYDQLARRTLGYSVKHTLLVHFNLLNALFLNDVIEMLRAKGWQLIDAEDAFSDPVFAAKPKILPAGESIIWSVAKEKGTIPMSQRYPAEDGAIEDARMNKLGL